MRLGVHISGVSRLPEAFTAAEELGCETIQIFARSPQRWRGDFLDKEEMEKFKRRKQSSGIKPVFIHISYLINLASPDPKLYAGSVEAYIEDILEAQCLEADYIVTHMGSHKETSEEAGIERLIKALNTIIQKTKGSPVGILLENTSGSGSWLGYKFIHQKKIIEGLDDKKRIGICFDTAHAYLAGYELSTKQGLQDTLDEIDQLVGLNLLKLVHLNDAKGKLGSHHDRHDHIGKGSIGMEGMKRIINHPRLKNCAFILETPKDSAEADRKNLEVVRQLMK